jgi:DNA-binding MarR family transcriptional regulator
VSSGEAFSDDELGAWHGLLRTHALVIRRLDEELTRQHRISVSEFDVLITLDNAPDRELRMGELAEAVMLSSSGLTRLVTRLERDGLVLRRQDPADARSFRAALTEAGAACLLEARVTHNSVIRKLFLSHLSAAQQRQLGAAWGAVHRMRG